jgi:hypothetical protein
MRGDAQRDLGLSNEDKQPHYLEEQRLENGALGEVSTPAITRARLPTDQPREFDLFSSEEPPNRLPARSMSRPIVLNIQPRRAQVDLGILTIEAQLFRACHARFRHRLLLVP